MESGKDMEEKLGSRSDVVVSIEEDNKNMQVPVETSCFSPQDPKSSPIATPNMPSETPVEAATEASSRHQSSIRMESSICNIKSKTNKGNVRTSSRIEEVNEESDVDEDDEDEMGDDGQVIGNETSKTKQKTARKWEVMYMIEFTICSCIIAVFITSLTVRKLRHVTFWGLEIWRWCVLLFVIFCGRLLTEGFTNVLVFLIERNFVLKRKVLYFVHSLKRSVQVFFWLALVLLVWVILVRKRLKEPKDTVVVLRHITRFLLSSLFGAGLWVVKTLLVKILACSFHVKRFFDRIQDSIFQQYVLLKLSEPRKDQKLASKTKPLLTLQKFWKEKLVEKQTVDVEKLSKMIKEKVSAWTISSLIYVIQGSELTTISGKLDESLDITNEEAAKQAGNQIFTNVAKADTCNPQHESVADPELLPRSDIIHKAKLLSEAKGVDPLVSTLDSHPQLAFAYIDEADLLQFLKKKDVDKVFDMFKCSAKSRKIKKKAIRDWVVKVYKERELLGHSIKDAKTAIEEMNRILSGMALLVIIFVWLYMMGLASTQLYFFLTSQLVLVTFIFGNCCKTGFECIIFIFVMHPYDVGDHCIIEGVQMIVEEMNILTTIFKSDKETIVYPNSVLATKPISNFYRSPVVSESVEFVIDVSTSRDTIDKLKNKIQAYIEKKDNQWNPCHQFKEIKDGNKLKMVLYANPITRFQDYGENSSRRPELLSKLKKILEELEITYHYLPQESHLNNVGSDAQ